MSILIGIFCAAFGIEILAAGCDVIQANRKTRKSTLARWLSASGQLRRMK